MDYIEIHGFKSIKNQRVEVSPINILIGANGSGKSNFISFFDFLNRLLEKKLNDYIALSGGADKILHKGKKVTNEIKFDLSFEQGTNAYSAHIAKGAEHFVFLKEGLLFQEELLDISASNREANLKDHNGEYGAKYIKEHLEKFKKYHFHDTSDKSPFTAYSDIENDAFFLYSDGANIAAFLYNIKSQDPKAYQRIVKVIQSIAPYFSDFHLQPNQSNLKKIKLHWTDRYSEVIYGPTDLSDGTLRFIALTILFMQPDPPNTIIIDEPELGLHPAAIAKLSGMIKSVASRNCQVILATQSTDLLSHFTAEDIITVDQVGGESIFRKLDSEKLSLWLEEYTIDDLWKRNIISSGQLNYTTE